MNPKYRKNTYIGIGLGGVVSALSGAIIKGFGEKMSVGGIILFTILSLGGAGFYLWGCCSWAKGKGYQVFYGFLLGILNILGLLILLLLPDKYDLGKNSQENLSQRTDVNNSDEIKK